MKQEYYKLPLDFDRFFSGDGQFEKCTEAESIDQHIELLLTTCPGKHRFNPGYGCRIWELDFQTIASFKKWEELFRQYVLEAVERYEPRITDIALDIRLRDLVREERQSHAITVRKRADIHITARMLSTGEPIRMGYTLYLGPLSNE